MQRHRVREKPGRAYLVGAGPGELQLLTLRARTLLERADVLIYDYLANERLLEWAPNAKAIYVGKKSGKHTMSQIDINALLVKEVKKGGAVVRLKGGDPLLFGRGGEEGRALAKAGLTFEIVPGITSALSVPAYAGIPVTERNSSASIAIVTGHEHTGKDESAVDYKALAKFGTVIFLMGMKKMAENLTLLRKSGKSGRTPAAAIQWGATPEQRTVVGTLADLAAKSAAAGLGPPGIVIVGKTVSLRQDLNWFESRPWFGRRVVLTRSRDANPEFVDELESRGAFVHEVPSIRIAPPTSFEKLDRAIRGLAKYDWLVFTSRNGVDSFWQRLDQAGKDARSLAGAKVAAVGPVTERALASHGIRADVMPKKFQSAYLLEALGKRSIKGKRILFLRAEQGNDDFLLAAGQAGAKIDLAPAYRTLSTKRPAGFTAVDREGRTADLYVFASPSAVESFTGMLSRKEKLAIKGAPAACIGPVTAAAAKEFGYTIAVVPHDHTTSGLLDAMEAYFRRT